MALEILAESGVPFGCEVDVSSVFPLDTADCLVIFASPVAGLVCSTAVGSGLVASGNILLRDTGGNDGDDGAFVLGAGMERMVVLRCREKGLGVSSGLGPNDGLAVREPR